MLPIVGEPETRRRGLAPYREGCGRDAGCEQMRRSRTGVRLSPHQPRQGLMASGRETPQEREAQLARAQGRRCARRAQRRHRRAAPAAWAHGLGPLAAARRQAHPVRVRPGPGRGRHGEPQAWWGLTQGGRHTR
jgi:hypothetical protein